MAAESAHDVVFVCEVCEHEGPKLIAYADQVGVMDADEFLADQSDDVREQVCRFVVSVLATDHHYHRTGASDGPGQWKLPPDCHVLLHRVTFLQRRLAAFVYHFTLPDLEARGHVRPHCIIYGTHQPTKLVPYFKKLKQWLSNAVEPWKIGSYRYFVSRASHIIKGANSVLRWAKANKLHSGDTTGPVLGEDSSQEQLGGWFSRLGGFWRGSEGQGEGVQLPVADIEREIQNLGQMIQEVKSCLPEAEQAISEPNPRAEAGLVDLTYTGWSKFLTNFVAKNPAREPLLKLSTWIGDEMWTSGLRRLVLLVLQVLDRVEMDLMLFEQDWRSVYQSPYPNTTLCFGGRLALGTDLQCDVPMSGNAKLEDPTDLRSPYSHPPKPGLHTMFYAYPGAMKSIVYSILKGRPVFIVGDEGGSDKPLTVRWVIDVLKTFVISCGQPRGVVEWIQSEITLSSLSFFKLCGIPDVKLLKHPVPQYCSILDMESKSFEGPTYHGRWLDELFGKTTAGAQPWLSEETLAAATQALLLQIGLTAAVVHHSTLLRNPIPTMDVGLQSKQTLHLSLSGSTAKQDAQETHRTGFDTARTLDMSRTLSSPVQPPPCSTAPLGGLCSSTAELAPSPLSGVSLDQGGISEANSGASSLGKLGLVVESPHGPGEVAGGHEGAVASRTQRPTTYGPSLAAVLSAASIHHLRDLGVPDGDAAIIRHGVRVLRDAPIHTPNKVMRTNCHAPLSDPAVYAPVEDGQQVPFPIIRLSHWAKPL